MWRRMTTAYLPQVNAIAARVHPDYPEDAAVFAERLALYPHGCHVLEDKAGVLDGYAVSHPWHDAGPPALNTLLHALPAAPTTYYIHDLALLPSTRGGGAGAAIVRHLIDHARQRGLSSVALVAVNGSEAFWQKHGFQPAHNEDSAAKERSYGAAARSMRLTLPRT
jgi:GNAT superfamily N-acetyltransferase